MELALHGGPFLWSDLSSERTQQVQKEQERRQRTKRTLSEDRDRKVEHNVIQYERIKCRAPGN